MIKPFECAESNVTIQKMTKLHLSEHCGIPVVLEEEEEETNAPLFLQITKEGLFLSDGKMKMQGDFLTLLPRLKKDNLKNESIVKAVKGKNGKDHPIVIDATAGMGEDAFLLAASGCEIILFEKNPIIASLLSDALIRGNNNETTKQITEKMHFYEKDSIQSMKNGEFTADIILLDPMFPEKKKSASVKKKFQLLHYLEAPCENEKELLEAAMIAARDKVVIKRPVTAPPLANQKPDYSIPGTTIRYDIILKKIY